MREYFPKVQKVAYKGPKSLDPLSYRYYDPQKLILGKPMRLWLKLSVAYWHTFTWPGSDPFGSPSLDRPWNEGSSPQIKARNKADAAFEFFTKLGVDYFCFHDLDIAFERETFAETLYEVKTSADYLMKKMAETGVKVLWGTANLFSHPRYMAGAFTNPNPEVFAVAAAQVKNALDITHEMGGENFVFWGGREGYETLLNTNMRQETEQMARFFHMICNYKQKIGFKGAFLIEPKPCEPTKHQYDHDSASVHAFLLKHGLEKEFSLNLEANHATLAGHSFAHEVAYALAHDLLGSIDANRGDSQLGWDTDQFPMELSELSYIMYLLLREGKSLSGGFNFDAKVRRQSIDTTDLFYGHIAGIDALARSLEIGEKMVQNGCLQSYLTQRYQQWHSSLGKEILEKNLPLEEVAQLVDQHKLDPKPHSGRQEMLEAFLNNMLQ
ncbi:MAG: xylose isomerase [Chlamydiota bacterium]